MRGFYTRAIEDDILGPYFTHELGEDIENEDWSDHIELLADFWLMQMLGEDTYYGNYIGAHVKMPIITKESFVRWVELFSLSADEVYVSKIANEFKQKGKQLSIEFQNSDKKI